MNKCLRTAVLASIALISLLMHYRDFSKDLMSLHVWRQTQTQSTIINFYEEDMNIFNPRRNDRGDTGGLFRMEFPLMQWLVACTYQVFGNHLVITRIFMFITCLFSVLGIYTLFKFLFRNETLALIGAWAFNFSPSFFYFSVNPLPDNFALCCSIWGLAFFFKWLHQNSTNLLVLSGLFLCAGALCKLPFIAYFIVPFLYFTILFIKHKASRNTLKQAVVVILFFIPPVAWYMAVIPQWKGNPVVSGMLEPEVPFLKTLDFYQHNLISTLPELLLNYGAVLFFLAGFYSLYKTKAFRNPNFPLILGLGVLLLVYYFFEANAIGKAHDYYLFPFLPLLFMLVGYGASHLLKSQKPVIRYLSIVLIILLPFTCYLRMKEELNPEAPGFNRDLLIYKTELQNAVPNNSLCVAGNDESHFIFFYYIGKKGWGFQDDRLGADELKNMIAHGAKYLYSDSRKTENDAGIGKCIDSLVLEKGSIKIFRLKTNPDVSLN